MGKGWHNGDDDDDDIYDDDDDDDDGDDGAILVVGRPPNPVYAEQALETEWSWKETLQRYD